MYVGPTGPVGGTNPIEPKGEIRPADSAPSLPPIQDKVEVSEVARLASEALSISPVRADAILEVKGAIQAGTFETAERLEAALQRFLEANPDLLS